MLGLAWWGKGRDQVVGRRGGLGVWLFLFSGLGSAPHYYHLTYGSSFHLWELLSPCLPPFPSPSLSLSFRQVRLNHMWFLGNV